MSEGGSRQAPKDSGAEGVARSVRALSSWCAKGGHDTQGLGRRGGWGRPFQGPHSPPGMPLLLPSASGQRGPIQKEGGMWLPLGQRAHCSEKRGYLL